MNDKKLVRTQDGNIIKTQPRTDHFYSVRYGATVKTFDDFREEDNAKRWFTVYFNDFGAANNFALFIKTRFGHAWFKKEECKPDLFYESIEDVLLGVYWKWNEGHKKYHKYKYARCCFEPLCKADIKKDPSE